MCGDVGGLAGCWARGVIDMLIYTYIYIHALSYIYIYTFSNILIYVIIWSPLMNLLSNTNATTYRVAHVFCVRIECDGWPELGYPM